MNMGPWKMAFRNLARNKRRNIATATAMALGFGGLITCGAYYYREDNLRRVFTVYLSHIGHITIYKQGGLKGFEGNPERFSLSENDQAVISRTVAGIPNVEIHGAQIEGAGVVGNSCQTRPFLAAGIDPEVYHQLRTHPEVLKWAPHYKEFIKGRGIWEYPEQLAGVALSSGLAKLLAKSRVYDEIPKNQAADLIIDCKAADAKQKLAGDSNVQLAGSTWSGTMAALDGEVVTQFSTGNSQTNSVALLAPLKYLQKLYDTKNATVYSVWLKDPSQLPATMKELDTKLKEAGLSVDLYPWTDEELAPTYSGTMEFINVVMAFIVMVTLTIVVFSVFNSATMTVMERSREIGMMRSLGYTRRRIRVLFLLEITGLGAIAIAAGSVIGTLLVFGLNHSGIKYNPPGMDMGDGVFVLVDSVVSSFAAGVLIFLAALSTTLLAAWAVAKQTIASLLAGTAR